MSDIGALRLAAANASPDWDDDETDGTVDMVVEEEEESTAGPEAGGAEEAEGVAGL